MSSAFQDSSGIAFDEPPCFTPGKQGLQADPVAVDGGLGPWDAATANLDALCGHETGQQTWGDALNSNITGKGCEHRQIPPVRRYRVRRAAFGFQIAKKLFNRFWYSHGALLLFCGWIVVMVHTRSIGGLYQGISDYNQTIYEGEVLATGEWW